MPAPSFVCPPCSSCVRVCCCFSRGLLDRVGRACCLVHVSFCGECSVVALRGVVWVVHDGRGDGTQKWHVVWGLLAACVLRFCVALRCENRNG